MSEYEIRSKYSDACNSTELLEQYYVSPFLLPFVYCNRKSDGARGTMQMQHEPRMYYRFISSN